MKRILSFALILFLTGCGINVVMHDEHKAADEANAVAKLLYINEDYSATYSRLSPDFQKILKNAETLKKVVDSMKYYHGELIELRLYSHGAAPGSAP